MTKKLVVHWLLAVALVAMPLVITACNQVGERLTGVETSDYDQVTQDAFGEVNKASSRFATDQCTWYAASEFDKVAPSPDCNWGGNAGTWIGNASANGWKTFTSSPTEAGSRSLPPGSIIVWTSSSYGHVAVLRSVVQNGIYIQEQNWPLGSGVSGWRYLTWATVQSRGSYSFSGYIAPWRK